MRLLLTAAVVGLTCPMASAGSILTEHLAGDTELINAIDELIFVAEGRIGDRGGKATFELKLNQDTGIPGGPQAQFDWQSGDAVDFTLTFNPGSTSTAQFSLGGQTLNYSFTGGTLPTDIFIRTRATKAGSSALVDSLVLDGDAVNDSSFADGDGAGLDNLRIASATMIDDGFVLTGSSVLSWDPNNLPNDSHLAFQIKVAVTDLDQPEGPPSTSPVPSPSVAATGLALFGLVMGRRRRV